jgi:hypothetical protein
MLMREIFRWSDLLAYLEEAHREVQEYPGDVVRFTYSHEGSDVPVGMHISRTKNGTPWLAVNMKVCKIGQLRVRSALLANVDLPIGGFCVLPEDGAIHQSMPFRAMLVADFEHVVASMAKLRAQLKTAAAMPDADIETPFVYLFR